MSVLNFTKEQLEQDAEDYVNLLANKPRNELLVEAENLAREYEYLKAANEEVPANEVGLECLLVKRVVTSMLLGLTYKQMKLDLLLVKTQGKASVSKIF